jgi:hypothetical protein
MFVQKIGQMHKIKTCIIINNDKGILLFAHYHVKPQLDSTPAASTILRSKPAWFRAEDGALHGTVLRRERHMRAITIANSSTPEDIAALSIIF